ncbi:hypothetical protein [Bradyrhizobium retamae]|uniref:hypothetical protein n=1 Tax=Bradyrhizobium retamae TaxID=1300035 RepID=UPI000A9D070C|nr:hypothetical protein [Bradyrhizobium retamae]
MFGGAALERDRGALTSIYDRPDNIPYVSRRGGYLYNLWKDANNPRGVWLRTSLEEFRMPKPSWEVLLDIDQLAISEGQDWLLKATASLAGDHRRMILSLSRGGSDAVTLREFDTGAKTFVSDGFVLQEAKGGVEWLDRDTLVLSSSHGQGMATTSGYARTVRLWRRGTQADQAPVIFEIAADHVGAGCDVDHTVAPPRMWFVDGVDAFNFARWLGDESGATTRINLPSNIWMLPHRDWLAIKDGREAPGDGLRGRFLRAGGGRPWLRPGQQRARRLRGAGLSVPEEQDRLA